MKSMQRRMRQLELPSDPGGARPLPEVVVDETTDAELALMRCNGRREVYRFSEFVDLAVITDSPAAPVVGGVA